MNNEVSFILIYTLIGLAISIGIVTLVLVCRIDDCVSELMKPPLDSYGITREDAINFLHNDGWLIRHDKELTKNKEPIMARSEFNNMCNMTFHYCGACGDGLPISAKRAKFCPWCGRAIKWSTD